MLLKVTIRVERHLVIIVLQQVLGIVKQGSLEPFERYVVDALCFFIENRVIWPGVNDLGVVPKLFPELEMVIDRPVVQIVVRFLKSSVQVEEHLDMH